MPKTRKGIEEIRPYFEKEGWFLPDQYYKMAID